MALNKDVFGLHHFCGSRTQADLGYVLWFGDSGTAQPEEFTSKMVSSYTYSGLDFLGLFHFFTEPLILLDFSMWLQLLVPW